MTITLVRGVALTAGQKILGLTPRKLQYGAGIYEAGETSRCYVKLFVTETGQVIPISGRCLSEDDLLQAYEWGQLDAEGKNHALDTGEDGDEESSMEGRYRGWVTVPAFDSALLEG